MHTIGEFLGMGGYAVYVWPSYALVFVVMVGGIWSAKRGLRHALEQAARRIEEETR